MYCTCIATHLMVKHFNLSPSGLPVPPSLQLLVVLSYMASGNFQLSIAGKSNVSQPSVSKYVKCVSTAIASLAPEVIKFPQPAEERQVMEKFVSIGGMPDVIGCINGSYIPILGVSGSNPELYRCKEGFFSINVMAVCDADLRFTSLITGWAGSVNNSRIFSSSNLHDLLESGVYKGCLLGDSGYACHPYLMTPCVNPATEKERRYNLAHAKTRNAIEKAFGIWKSRFAILKYKMRTNLRTANNIIIACAVLHNIALESRLDLIQESENVLPDAVGLVPHALAEDGPGRARRDAIIDTHF